MTSPTVSEFVGLDSLVASVLDEYRARLKRGERPNIDEYVAKHPEAADLLRNVLTTIQLLDLSLSGAGELPINPESGTLGDFQLIREVGRGGMGIVYEAMQMSLNRRVALKVLPWAAAMDPRQLQRFKNEALAAGSLRHEHIVHVYGVGCERGVHFYAMEFIEGQTLAQVIGERGCVSAPSLETPELGALTQPRSPETAPIAALSTKRDKTRYRAIAALVADAADALEHAHSLGIVHRDVKPGNLLLDNNGKIYVSDFGLARMASPGCEAGGLTMSGDMLGTLRYMAPEQALAKHGLADHRVDVYGLGCTLYELLTGKPAVRGEDKEEILKHIVFEEPTSLRKLDKSIPAELETITLKCLAKEPGERYASAGELAADLRRWLGDQAIKAKPPTKLNRIGKLVRRHKAVALISLGFVLLATIGLASAVVLLSNANRQTQVALDSESRARERVQGNLQLTLTALDEATQNRVGSMVERPFNRTKEELEASRKLRAYYEDFIRANADDPAFRLEVSKAYLRLGHFDIAEDTDQGIAATLKGLALADELLQESPDNPSIRHVRATGLAQQAWHNGFNISEAEPQVREAIGILEVLRQQGEPGTEIELPLLRLQRGQLLHHSNRHAEAATLFQRAAEEFGLLAKRDPENARIHALWGISLTNLEATLRRMGRLDEAANSIERASAELRQAVRLNPRDPIWRLYLRQTLVVLSGYHAGRTRPGLPRIEMDTESVTIMERLASDYPDFADYRYYLAVDLARLSFNRGEARQFDAALPPRKQSIALLDALLAESPTDAKYRTKRDESLWWLGVEQRNSGHEADALAAFSRIPESNRFYADAAWTRALIRLTAADPNLRDAREALKLTTWGADLATGSGVTKSPAEWGLLLAFAQFRSDDPAAAKSTLDGLKDLKADYSDIVLYIRAMVHWRLGDRDQARNLCQTAVEHRQAQPKWQLLEAFHRDALKELGLTEADFEKPKD